MRNVIAKKHCGSETKHVTNDSSLMSAMHVMQRLTTEVKMISRKGVHYEKT